MKVTTAKGHGIDENILIAMYSPSCAKATTAKRYEEGNPGPRII
jgi:hypothetical protein